MLSRNRRKYRKIMVKFEETMRESNDLFKEEQKMLATSRRLAEENEYETLLPNSRALLTLTQPDVAALG